MKKHIPVFISFFFILFTCNTFAGTPPSGTESSCTGGNNGSFYTDSTSGFKMMCTGLNASVQIYTMNLSTTYPSPIAAYNQITLSPNYAPGASTSPTGYCTVNPINASACTPAGGIFLDTSTDPTSGELLICPSSSASGCNPYTYCDPYGNAGGAGDPVPQNDPLSVGAGTLTADNTGTLHACVNTGTGVYKDITYPQQAYNVSCTALAANTPCTNIPPCKAGYAILPINSPLGFDSYQISATTWIDSYVCISQ